MGPSIRISYIVPKHNGLTVLACVEIAKDKLLNEWKPGHWHLEDVQEGNSAHAGPTVRVEFQAIVGEEWTSPDMHDDNWGIPDEGH